MIGYGESSRLGFRIQNKGSEISILGFRILGLGLRNQQIRVSDFRIRASKSAN
jgi:hypothetical protein